MIQFNYHLLIVAKLKSLLKEHSYRLKGSWRIQLYFSPWWTFSGHAFQIVLKACKLSNYSIVEEKQIYKVLKSCNFIQKLCKIFYIFANSSHENKTSKKMIKKI